MPIFRLSSTFRLRACAVFATLLCAHPGTTPVAQEDVYEAASLKAAFLYHFSTFVIWPESAPANEEFVIAVLGDDAIAGELRTYLPGHSIQGRPMRVRSLATLDEFADEAVLFIGAERNDQLAGHLETVANRPVLVVTDAPGALDKGSMINFKVVDDRIRFEISLSAAERAGLVLSSRLLSAAMFVDTTSAIIELPPISIVSDASATRVR